MFSRRSRLAACSALCLFLVTAGEAPAENATGEVKERIERLIPELETQLREGMKAFGTPGAAIGIVHEDRLIYAKGFGVREAGKTDPVNVETIFQIGSTTKAFLGVTLAQAVDRGKLNWSDRVVDLVDDFELGDPWITRDLRVVDIAAQRSGLTTYVNDGLIMLGYDPATLIRSLRHAPVTHTFRSDFTYVNILHMVGGNIVAAKAEADTWADVVRKDILEPLGMSSTTATAEAIEQAKDHAIGHRASETAPTPLPFHPTFPYAFGPAGALNSNVPDMAQWLRLQLGRGHFGEKVIVSEESLDATWTPRVAISERTSYAIGWVVNATPNGRVIWHNGGTSGFGAHAGFLPDRGVGIVILTNMENNGFPDAVAHWFYDRILGNPTHDNVALALEAARAKMKAEKDERPVADPAAKLDAALAGTYASPLLGEAVVTVSGPKSLLVRFETEAMLRLDLLYGDTFSVRLEPEGNYATLAANLVEGDLPPLRFERNEKGEVARMRWLDPALPQAFTRQQ